MTQEEEEIISPISPTDGGLARHSAPPCGPEENTKRSPG